MTDLLIKLFIKNPENTQDMASRQQYGRLAGIAGIVCNLVLFGLKLTVGLLSGSISVLADAFNNLSDTGSSLVTLFSFRLASKPADHGHPYGHGRLEYLSALIVAGLILLVGVELLKDSIDKLFHPSDLSFTLFSIVILALSALLKLWMFGMNRKLGRKIGSTALTATARDSLNDALSTTAVLLSALVMLFAHLNIDAYVGIAVSLFIVWSGVKTVRDTISPLLGEPLDLETAELLEREIMSFDGFLGIHDLVAHNYGPGRRFATVHVEVPADMDLICCHDQIDRCEKLIAEKTGIELTVHADPVETDNELLKSTKAMLSEKLKEIHSHLTLHDFHMVPKTNERINLLFDVVVPVETKLSHRELRVRIDALAKQLDPRYCCVISFDPDYTSRKHKNNR